MKYEVVIGLEVHAQLKTKARYFVLLTTFGAGPNENTCPLCTGMRTAGPERPGGGIRRENGSGRGLHREPPRFRPQELFYPDLPRLSDFPIRPARGRNGHIIHTEKGEAHRHHHHMKTTGQEHPFRSGQYFLCGSEPGGRSAH